MKADIHPNYQPVVFVDRATGDQFLTRSTATGTHTVTIDGTEYPAITVDITSASHPMWTGKTRELDTQGRLEKFRQRYGQGKSKGTARS